MFDDFEVINEGCGWVILRGGQLWHPEPFSTRRAAIEELGWHHPADAALLCKKG